MSVGIAGHFKPSPSMSSRGSNLKQRIRLICKTGIRLAPKVLDSTLLIHINCSKDMDCGGMNSGFSFFLRQPQHGRMFVD